MLVYKAKCADLNVKNNKSGQTEFYLLCEWDETSIFADNQYAEAFNIDLFSKDKNEKSGFQIAQDQNRTDIVTLIKI